MKNSKLSSLIDEIGQSNLARACGISPAGVNKWRHHGLPMTEYLPERDNRKTHYSQIMSRLLDGLYTVEDILK